MSKVCQFIHSSEVKIFFDDSFFLTGVPTSISNPHFLYGDKSLVNGVYGLAPDPDKHKNYFSVQPVSMPSKLTKVNPEL